MGVAQTAYSISAQAKQAKAQNAAISAQLDVTNEEARRKATAELFDASRATRREQGRIRAAAGEAGLALTGSVDALLFDSAMQSELNYDRSLANLESRTAANVAEAEVAYSNVSNTNALSAGLQLGASALSGWSGIEEAKIEKRRAAVKAG
jgi:hypothetical protein|tara:strand:- start:1365 stop:1817 length:453 start_codon:yes stop_codon:yes gene_type:complete